MNLRDPKTQLNLSCCVGKYFDKNLVSCENDEIGEEWMEHSKERGEGERESFSTNPYSKLGVRITGSFGPLNSFGFQQQQRGRRC